MDCQLTIDHGNMKRINIIFTIALLLVCMFTACSSDDDRVYTDVDEMIMEARENVSTISMEALAALIAEGAELQLVDCRPEAIYAEGHIPGAINVPLGLIGFSARANNRRPTTIVMGNDQGSAALAVQTLQKMKYFDVHMLEGSWLEWLFTYPDLFEEGTGDAAPAVAEEPAGGGGCGG